MIHRAACDAWLLEHPRCLVWEKPLHKAWSKISPLMETLASPRAIGLGMNTSHEQKPPPPPANLPISHCKTLTWTTPSVVPLPYRMLLRQLGTAAIFSPEVLHASLSQHHFQAPHPCSLLLLCSVSQIGAAVGRAAVGGAGPLEMRPGRESRVARFFL